jgi:hypothetical protein
VIGFNGTVLDSGTDDRVLPVRHVDGEGDREGSCERSGNGEDDLDRLSGGRP